MSSLTFCFTLAPAWASIFLTDLSWVGSADWAQISIFSEPFGFLHSICSSTSWPLSARRRLHFAEEMLPAFLSSALPVLETSLGGAPPPPLCESQPAPPCSRVTRV